jgi:hypothetical protein
LSVDLIDYRAAKPGLPVSHSGMEYKLFNLQAYL